MLRHFFNWNINIYIFYLYLYLYLYSYWKFILMRKRQTDRNPVLIFDRWIIIIAGRSKFTTCKVRARLMLLFEWERRLPARWPIRVPSNKTHRLSSGGPAISNKSKNLCMDRALSIHRLERERGGQRGGGCAPKIRLLWWKRGSDPIGHPGLGSRNR